MDFKQHFTQSWQVFTHFLPGMLILTVVVVVCSICSFGILAPVLTAGYMQSLLLAVREDRKPEAKDAFSHMHLFLPLFGFALLVGVVLFFGFALLVLPGLLLTLALSFFCLYMLLLMTDRDMGVFEALQESSRMALQPPVSEHIAVVAVTLVLNSLGSSTGLGWLFTMPFASLFVVLVYEAKVTRMLPGPGAAGSTSPPPPGS